MKLRSLLAIISCSAITLSFSLPSIAESAKESKIKSTLTGIGNKQRSLGEWFQDHSTKPLDFGSNSSTQNNERTQINDNQNTTSNERTQISGDRNINGDGNTTGERHTVCQEGSTCHINNSSDLNNGFDEFR